MFDSEKTVFRTTIKIIVPKRQMAYKPSGECLSYLTRFFFIILGIDPYVKILCEGEKVVSEKLLKTNMPVWNIKVTFYRKKPDEPIICEVS